MMLDRGQELDWFSSREIIVEAVVAGLAFYLFVVHMFTAERPFLPPGLFKDRNFASAIMMIFCVSSLMLATVVAAGALSAEPGGLPGLYRRLGDGAARHRHHHLDVPRRPAGHAGGSAQDHGGRPADPRLGALHHEHLDARRHRRPR